HMLQGQADRALAGISAFHDAHRLFELFLADAGVEAFDLFRAGGDNNLGNQGASRDAPQTKDDDGHAVQFEELLGRLVAHARAESSSGKNGGDMSHRKAVRLKRGPGGLSAGCGKESLPQGEAGREMEEGES